MKKKAGVWGGTQLNRGRCRLKISWSTGGVIETVTRMKKPKRRQGQRSEENNRLRAKCSSDHGIIEKGLTSKTGGA